MADTTFTVEVKEATGDRNDGFREAQTLLRNSARTGVLAPNDYQDWFTFTVDAEEALTIDASDSSSLRCLVYVSGDIDLFGFDIPECGHSYLYPPGKYYVSIGRKSPRAVQQTYTVQLR
jgi:hypothetical protein